MTSPEGAGFFLRPGALADVSNRMRVAREGGMGREMGMHAVNLYTEVKNIYFNQD